MKTAILYHANCVDGFTAAWTICRHSDDLKETRPVNYGDPLPADIGEYDRVFIVDFSYPHSDLVELSKTAEVVLLDHHKSAMDHLSEAVGDYQIDSTSVSFDEPYVCRFDMDRSGAGIAWDYITNGLERPALVDYVEDRDLWNNRLPGTREVSAYLRCLNHDLDEWDKLASTPIEDIIRLGEGVTTQLDAVIRAAVEHSYMCEMGGREFPIANVTYLAGSETAEALCERWDADMAGYYFRQADGRWKYGFRSRDGSVTVHDFAAEFGGGGHPSASGAVCDTIEHIQVPDVA